MRNLFVYSLLVTVLMLIHGSAAFAADWSADFETPPYVLDPINGQQGWYSGSTVPSVIADGTAPSGSQVLYVAGPTETGDAVGYPSANTDLVKLTFYMNGPTGAGGHAALHCRQGNTYFIMSEFQESSDAGWGYYNVEGSTGVQYAGVNGAKVAWNTGTWEKVEYWMDLANDQFTVEINDVLIDEWYDNGGALIDTHIWTPFINPVSGFDTLQIRIGTMYAVGTPYKVDGLVVEEIDLVPEVTSKQAGVMLQWDSVPGVLYKIYSSDDPAGEWELVDQVTADMTETKWVDVGDQNRENPASDTVTSRFYKIDF
jgi:hypothetical protein